MSAMWKKENALNGWRVRSVHVLHALMDDGVTSGLTDNEISPLNEDNRHEECGVAGVFKHLALSIRLHTHTHTNIRVYMYTTKNKKPKL